MIGKLIKRLFAQEQGNSSIELALVLALVAVPLLTATLSYATQVMSRQQVSDGSYVAALTIANDPAILGDAVRWQAALQKASVGGAVPQVSTVCLCANKKNAQQVSCTGNPCAGSPAAQYSMVTLSTATTGGSSAGGGSSGGSSSGGSTGNGNGVTSGGGGNSALMASQAAANGSNTTTLFVRTR